MDSEVRISESYPVKTPIWVSLFVFIFNENFKWTYLYSIFHIFLSSFIFVFDKIADYLTPFDTIHICVEHHLNFFYGYSLHPQKSVIFASHETTLTKYIKIYINIYGTKLTLLDRCLNLVFYEIYFETQMLHVFSTNPVKLVARKPTVALFLGRRD
jgi:hypothetical protein